MARDIDKRVDRARYESKVKYDIAQKAKSLGVFEKSGGVVVPTTPDITSRRRLGKMKSDYGNISSPSGSMPMTDVEKLFDTTKAFIGDTTFGIKTDIKGVKNMKYNAVQDNLTNVKTLMNLKPGEGYVAMIADTEWLGRGSDSTIGAAPYEFGMIPTLVTSDGVKILQDKATTIAMELDEIPAGQINKLIDRLERGEHLSSTEYRTLKDLVGYSGKTKIDSDGIVSRSATDALIDGQSLKPYIKEMKEGLEMLSNPSTKAVKRNDVASRLAKEVMNAETLAKELGYNVVDKNVWVFHNGYGADMKAIGESFGQNSNLYKTFEGKVVDTYALVKSLNDNPLGLYHDTKGSLKGFGTLESALKVFAPDQATRTSHVAGDDAFNGALLFKGLMENDKVKRQMKNVDMGNIVLQAGDSLYSTSSLRKEGPLDSAYKMKDGKWEAISYQPVASYNRSMHQVVREFEYKYGDKNYFGIVMRNTDDDIMSVVARESKHELRNTIQSSFVRPDSVTNFNEQRLAGHEDKARRAYRGMFSGTSASNDFERYVGAAEKIVSGGGELTDEAVAGLKLTEAQERNFRQMYPRLKEELPYFQDFRDNVLNNIRDKDTKSVALEKYYSEFKEVVYKNADGGFDNLGTVNLVNDYIKDGKWAHGNGPTTGNTMKRYIEEIKPMNLQGKIYNPNTREMISVNLNSVESFASSINYSVGAPTQRNADLMTTDVLVNLRNFIHSEENRGVIEESKSKKLLSILDRVDSFHGSGKDGRRGVHDVATEIASEIIGDVTVFNMREGLLNKIDDQEMLRVGSIKGRAEKLAQLNSKFDGIKEYSNHFFANVEGLGFRTKEAKEAIEGMDDFLKRYVENLVPNVKSGKVQGPKSIIENLNDIARNFSTKGMIVDFAMANDNKSLMMSVYDADLAVSTMKKANIKLPLIDIKSGMIDFHGHPNANALRPVLEYKQGVGYTSNLRVDTYINKALDSVMYPGSVAEISQMIKHGNIDGAESYAKRIMNKSIEGIPAASTKKLRDDKLSSGTTLGLYTKGGYVDSNDLYYQLFGSSMQEMKKRNKAEFQRMVMYDDEVASRVFTKFSGGRTNEARDFRSYMQKAFGNEYTVSQLKSERAVDGFYSIINTRELGMFGTYSDVGRENPRQALNYIRFNDDDLISTGITRKSKLDEFEKIRGKSARDRLTHRIGGTSRYLEHVEAETVAFNIDTMFVNDQEVTSMLTDKAKGAPFMRRPHVHDDIAFMRSDVAELMGTMQDKRILFTEGQDASELINKAEIGKTVIRKGDVIGYDLDKKAIRYESRFDSIFDGYKLNEETMAYEINLRQIRQGEEGMKIFGVHGGNKATVRLLTPEEWSQTFKKEYQDIEMIANFSAKKMPADILASQANYMVDQLSVGGLSNAEIRSEVQGVLKGSLSRAKGSTNTAIDEILNAVQVNTVNGRAQLTMPDRMSETLNVGKYIEGTTNVLDKYSSRGVKSNIIDGHLRGLGTMGRADVNDGYAIYGDETGNGVKIGLRELEMVKTRKYLDPDLELTHTVKRMEELITQNAEEYKGEARQIYNALWDAGGKTIDDKDSYSVVRLKNFQDARPIDKYFADLNPLGDTSSLNDSKLRNTIFDKGTFNKGGFFLELPDQIEIGDQKLDKIFMPVLSTEGVGNELYLSEIQKTQKSIFSNIQKMQDNSSGGAEQEEIYKEASRRLYGTGSGKKQTGGLIRQYYSDLDKAARSSDGHVFKNMFSSRVDASAQLHFSAVSPSDYIDDSIVDRLEEGSALMSRADFKEMIKKVNPKEHETLVARAQSDGVVGLGLRFPTMQHGSIQPVKYKILSEELEDQLTQNGQSFMDGKVYVTVGTQKRWGADFDGDMFFGFLPQLSGNNVKTMNNSVNSEMRSWFNKEQKWMNEIAAVTYKDLGESAREGSTLLSGLKDISLNTVDSVSDDIQRLIETEARYMKDDVGGISNLSYRYRRMAESVGSLTREENTFYPVTAVFGGAAEQLPISSKRFGEKIQDMIRTSGDYSTYTAEEGMELAMNTAQDFVQANLDFKEASSSFDVEGILSSSRRLGLWGDDGFFSGSVKGEDIAANIQLGRKGADRIHFDEFERVLYEMKSYDNIGGKGNSIWTSMLNMGIGGSPTVEKGIENAKNILDPNDASNVFGTYSGGDLIMNTLFGDMGLEGISPEKAQETIARHKLINGIDGITTSRKLFDTVSEGAFSTMGADSVSAILGDTAPSLSKMGGKALAGAGIALGGLMVMGRIMGGVTADKNIQRGRADKAPSSDGEYIDPSIYAGAPMGSAPPTARVMANDSGYQRTNINISANSMSGMTNEEIAGLVSNEVQRQSGIQMNINLTSQDDRTSIDKQWLQSQFASALNSGHSR